MPCVTGFWVNRKYNIKLNIGARQSICCRGLRKHTLNKKNTRIKMTTEAPIIIHLRRTRRSHSGKRSGMEGERLLGMHGRGSGSGIPSRGRTPHGGQAGSGKAGKASGGIPGRGRTHGVPLLAAQKGNWWPGFIGRIARWRDSVRVRVCRCVYVCVSVSVSESVSV